MVTDFARRPLSELHVLDLACLEGDFGVEFALRGATVLGIEGRRTNIERAKAKHAEPNLEFVQDDVRNLSRDKYGAFDVVLCLGILYHLDAPDCFELLESISDVCTGVAVIDTHVGLTGDDVVSFRGNTYRGWRYTEYATVPTAEEEEEKKWASMQNTKSFWPTKPSLVNAIARAGFASVYECEYPAWNDIPADRVAFAAVKGQPERPLAGEADESIFSEAVDEHPKVPAVSRPRQQEATVSRTLRTRISRALGRARH
jgi:hypothetical protein